MKKPVHDDLVKEYVKRLRSGEPLGEVFPQPISECDFTEVQKLAVKEARKVREKLFKKSKPQPATPPPTKTVVSKPVAPSPKVMVSKLTSSFPALAPKSQSLKKLQKMFFLQHEKCFFCGEKLTLTEANIEHLHPLSKGGTRTADNEVVCHKSLNETFGNLPLKQKFEFVLKAAGSFQCPKK